MNLDKSLKWDESYNLGKGLNNFAFSDLVSIYYRYVAPNIISRDRKLRILEIGPGTGNNYTFLKTLNCEYYSCELSKVAHEIMMSKYPNLSSLNNLNINFNNSSFIENSFDIIVDRAALTHSPSKDLIKSIKIVNKLLISGGYFVAIDWFNKDHPDSSKGTLTDRYTRTDIEEGQFKGVEFVHFFDKGHLMKLFKNFDVQVLNRRVIYNEMDSGKIEMSTYNLVARKV